MTSPQQVCCHALVMLAIEHVQFGNGLFPGICYGFSANVIFSHDHIPSLALHDQVVNQAGKVTRELAHSSVEEVKLFF